MSVLKAKKLLQKKKIFLILLIGFLLSIWSQSNAISLSNLFVSDAEVVSTESIGNSNNPSLVIDDQNNVHIVWDDSTNFGGSGTDADIFYKFWNATSENWSFTEVVSTESTELSGVPRLTIDNQNNLHVVWWDFTDYGGSGTDADIFYKFWNATSGSWRTTEIVSTESTSGSSYPSLAIDSQDNVHVVWSDSTDYGGSGTDSDIFYKLWNITSGSWSITEVVSTESIGSSQSTSLVIDNQDNVHVVWSDSTDYGGSGIDSDIFYKFWNTTSGSWNITMVISTESTGASYRANMEIDSHDTVHILWSDSTDYSSSGTDFDIFYKFWNATIASWSRTEIVSTESTGASYTPKMVIDSYNNIHMVWDDLTDYLGSGTDRDMFYKFWSVTSKNWSTTAVVSTESDGFSYAPSLAIDPQNNVHVVWYDTTDYLSSGTDNDIFYKFMFNLNLLSQTDTDTDDSTVTKTEISTVTDIETAAGTTITHTTTSQVEGSIQTITEIRTENVSVSLVPILFSVLILIISRFRRRD